MKSTHSRRVRMAALVTSTVVITTALGPPAAAEIDAAASPPTAGGTGTVVGWGLDGEFGPPAVPSGLADVVASDAHGYLGAVVRADGTAAAWLEGSSDWDLEGWTAGLTDVVELAVGGAHLVARHADGSLSAHGWDAYGQATVPPGLTDVVAIDAGSAHNVALRADGTVVAWGDDSDGAADVPEGLHDVVAVSAGSAHSLAVRANGTVVAWGRDRSGQASPPQGLEGVVAVTGGSDHSVALRADGTVVAWGDPDRVVTPAGLDDVVDVAAGNHTVALRRDGTVVAWGSPHETWGGSTSVPTGLGSVLDVATGGPYSIVVVAAGAAVPLPDTTPPQIRHKGPISKAATSARGARIWFTPSIVDDVFTDPYGTCSHARGEWYPLETTTVSCSAQDWAGNTSEAEYEVRVTWSWSGLQLPTRPDGLVRFDHGEGIPLSFKLTKGSVGAADARATLWYARVADGVVGDYVQVRDPFTDRTRFSFDGWKYVMYWSTRTTPGPGTYVLKVDLGDGVERTTLVELV